MEQTGRLRPAGTLPIERGRPHPQLVQLDRVRETVAPTGLPPVPDVYELLWHHVDGGDPSLSRAVDAALAGDDLDLATVAALRAAHLGPGAGDVSALIAAAHGQAERIAEQVAGGRSDLAAFGAIIAQGDAMLRDGRRPSTPAALATIIEGLGAATASMIGANERLQNQLASSAAEVDRLRERLERAERASITDQLTGLFNRRGTVERLAAELLRPDRPALAVALIDIDHFKQVNDRWGHAVGDEVLRFVARHLGDGMTGASAVGRWGGEEFVVILPATAGAAAMMRIDAMRARLAAQLIRRSDDGSTLGRVTFSAGVSVARPGDEVDVLIGRADAALYLAKRLGRDRVIPDCG